MPLEITKSTRVTDNLGRMSADIVIERDTGRCDKDWLVIAKGTNKLSFPQDLVDDVIKALREFDP